MRYILNFIILRRSDWITITLGLLTMGGAGCLYAAIRTVTNPARDISGLMPLVPIFGTLGLASLIGYRLATWIIADVSCVCWWVWLVSTFCDGVWQATVGALAFGFLMVTPFAFLVATQTKSGKSSWLTQCPHVGLLVIVGLALCYWLSRPYGTFVTRGEDSQTTYALTPTVLGSFIKQADNGRQKPAADPPRDAFTTRIGGSDSVVVEAFELPAADGKLKDLNGVIKARDDIAKIAREIKEQECTIMPRRKNVAALSLGCVKLSFYKGNTKLGVMTLIGGDHMCLDDGNVWYVLPYENPIEVLVEAANIGK